MLIAISGALVIVLSTLVLTAFGPATHFGLGAAAPSTSASPPDRDDRALDSTLLPARVPDEVPVLLVHGYKGGPSQLEAISDQLERDGRRVVPVVLPQHGTGDLRFAAFAIGIVARDLGAPRIDVVGFSLGGLVARSWLLMNDPNVEIRHLVMLATPNSGIGLPEDSGLPYQEGCPTNKACGQLRPDSTFLRLLDDSPLTRGREGWLTVASESDRLVQPPAVVALPGARNLTVQQVCPGLDVDHGAMDRAPVIVGVVRLFLDQQLPVNPTCADALTAASG
jgi:triacylglycerol lipase